MYFSSHHHGNPKKDGFFSETRKTFLMLCHVPLPSSWEEWFLQRKHVFWGGVFYFFPVDVCGNSGFLSAESSEKALSLTH